MSRLENKVALISGGARGMGAVEAKLFAREGARVVIADVLEEDGRKTEAEINEDGGECLLVTLDVDQRATPLGLRVPDGALHADLGWHQDCHAWGPRRLPRLRLPRLRHRRGRSRRGLLPHRW